MWLPLLLCKYTQSHEEANVSSSHRITSRRPSHTHTNANQIQNKWRLLLLQLTWNWLPVIFHGNTTGKQFVARLSLFVMALQLDHHLPPICLLVKSKLLGAQPVCQLPLVRDCEESHMQADRCTQSSSSRSSEMSV